MRRCQRFGAGGNGSLRLRPNFPIHMCTHKSNRKGQNFAQTCPRAASLPLLARSHARSGTHKTHTKKYSPKYGHKRDALLQQGSGRAGRQQKAFGENNSKVNKSMQIFQFQFCSDSKGSILHEIPCRHLFRLAIFSVFWGGWNKIW